MTKSRWSPVQAVQSQVDSPLLRRELDLIFSGLPLVAIAVYLGAIEITRQVPLAPGLAALFIFPPLILSAVQRYRIHALMRKGRLERWHPSLRQFMRTPLVVFFAILAGVIFFECVRGTMDVTIIKTHEWRIVEGVYYSRERGGVDQSWNVISKATYVMEVGSWLRAAAGFGAFIICTSFAMSEGIRIQRRR